MLAQHLSHHIDTCGPIARPPNEEEAQQQQAAASLDGVLPFLGATTLEHQGFNKAFLKDVHDNKTYTASGSLLNETANLKAKRRDIHLMDKHSLHRLSTATWNVVKSAFDVSNIDEDDLSPHIHGLHAYQLIISVFSNRVHHAKHEISDRILALNSRTTPTVEALLELFRDTKALTMLHRIIQGEFFFVKSSSLLPKFLDYMQSSSNIRTISPSIQGEFLKSLRFFHGIAQQNESILATAVLNRLTPILLKSSTSRDSIDSAFLTRVRSQDDCPPSPRSAVETSFAAYHEHERRPRPPPSSERTVLAANQDQRNSARRESGVRLPDRTPPTSRQRAPAVPPPHGSHRAVSRPGPPPPDLWKELQEQVSQFQSKIDGAKRQAMNGPTPPRPTASAPPRQTAFQALPDEYVQARDVQSPDSAWALTATFSRDDLDSRSQRDDRRSSRAPTAQSFGSSDEW